MAATFTAALASVEEEASKDLLQAEHSDVIDCGYAGLDEDGLGDLSKEFNSYLEKLEVQCAPMLDKATRDIVANIKRVSMEITSRVLRRESLAAVRAKSEFFESPMERSPEGPIKSDSERTAELKQQFRAALSGMEAESRRADFWVQRAEQLGAELIQIRTKLEQGDERQTPSEDRAGVGKTATLFITKLRALLNGGCAESLEEQALVDWLRAMEVRAVQAETERDHAIQQLSVVEKELIEKMTRDTTDLREKLDAALEAMSAQRKQIQEQKKQFADERATFWEELEVARMVKVKPPKEADVETATVMSAGTVEDTDGTRSVPHVVLRTRSSKDASLEKDSMDARMIFSPGRGGDRAGVHKSSVEMLNAHLTPSTTSRYSTSAFAGSLEAPTRKIAMTPRDMILSPDVMRKGSSCNAPVSGQSSRTLIATPSQAARLTEGATPFVTHFDMAQTPRLDGSLRTDGISLRTIPHVFQTPRAASPNQRARSPENHTGAVSQSSRSRSMEVSVHTAPTIGPPTVMQSGPRHGGRMGSLGGPVQLAAHSASIGGSTLTLAPGCQSPPVSMMLTPRAATGLQVQKSAVFAKTSLPGSGARSPDKAFQFRCGTLSPSVG